MSESQPTKSPRRVLIQKSLLIVGSIIIGVALGEVILRIKVSFLAGTARPLFAKTVSSTLMERADETRNHALIEGAEFIATGNPPGLEFCTYGSVNAQGLNDDPVPLKKAPGELRVLVLGDSFVEARQVQRQANFCKVLQRDLAAKYQRPVRVINAGVSSYSPLLCYIYFVRELAQYEPDIVLFAFFANDVFDDLRYTHVASFGPDGKPTAVHSGAPWPVFKRETGHESDAPNQQALRLTLDSTPSWWSSHFYLAAMIKQFTAARALKKTFATLPPNDEFFILENNPDLKPLQDHGWKLTQKYLGLLKDACDRSHSKFALTCVPIASQITGHSSYDHFFFSGQPTDANESNIKRIAADLKVPYTDLFSPLRKDGGNLYFPHDGHWTPRAHRIVAQSLSETVSHMTQN